jgi:hypothetical protein
LTRGIQHIQQILNIPRTPYVVTEEEKCWARVAWD